MINIYIAMDPRYIYDPIGIPVGIPLVETIIFLNNYFSGCDKFELQSIFVSEYLP